MDMLHISQILDGVLVYEARLRMGESLARRIIRLYPDHDIDSVMPIPETSRTATMACASILQLPYREGFVKNRYIARTFIMPVSYIDYGFEMMNHHMNELFRVKKSVERQ
jgi:amidophosphoribosyltransferase